MVATPSLTRWKKTDFTWLALAIGIHCVFLLLPLHQLHLSTHPGRAEPGRALAVELIPYTRSGKAQTKLEIPPPPAAKPSTAAPSQAAHEPGPAAPVPTPADPLLANETATSTGIKPMSAARLLDLVSRMSFTPGQTPARRQLGSSEYRRQAPSWRTRAGGTVLLPERNTFDGMMAPAETELVDRWQAADGSNNVVINTPSGDTLCGRAEPWNPMQPLVEHLMMFRSCGGGGKRTFSMAARKLP